MPHRILQIFLFFMFITWDPLHAGPQADASQATPWIRSTSSNNGVIVFVHGVIGDAVSTWTSGQQYWPKMLTNDPDFNGQDIYVYRYPSPRSRRSLSVDEVAENMRLVLQSDGVLDRKQITFLSHSLGGVVTRAFIVKYQRELLGRIRFLYFFATPTTGSPYATLASIVSKNTQFKSMIPLNSDNYLGTLQSSWLAASLGIRSYCAYEVQPLYGQIIVERQSATNLCTQRLDPIDADHLTIVKPTNQRSTSYLAFKSAFRETSPPPPVRQNKPRASTFTLDEMSEFAGGAAMAVKSEGEAITGTAFYVHTSAYAITCSSAVYRSASPRRDVNVGFSGPIYASQSFEVSGSEAIFPASIEQSDMNEIVLMKINLDFGQMKFAGPSLRPSPRVIKNSTSEMVVGKTWILPLASEVPKIGTNVTMYGVEKSFPPSYSTLEGRITRLGSSRGGIAAFSNLQYRSTYCGAPVLDQRQNVLGIVVGKSEDGETQIALARYIENVMRKAQLKGQ